MDYRSPLEGSYEDQETYTSSSYGSARYSPYAVQSHGYWPRSGTNERRPPHGICSRPLYERDQSCISQPNNRGYCEPNTSEHRPKYSDQFKHPSYPKELSDLMGALECKLCGVEVPSPIVAKMHYSGKPHFKKIKQYLMEYSLRTGVPMPNLEELPSIPNRGSVLPNYCAVCDVTLISDSDKMLHYTGVKHRKNSQDPSNAKKKQKAYETIDLRSGRFGIGASFSNNALELLSSKEKTHEEFVCEMCDVKAVSQEQLDAHLSGKKHKEKLEKKTSLVPKPVNPSMSILASIVKELPSQTVDYSMHRTPSGQYYCGVCNLSLNAELQFIEHVENKKHKKKLLGKKRNEHKGK